jgi:hypothetical protein
MLLTEIARGILLEGKASSFIKFYQELKRGYNPDNATLFDCLTTLKEYYEDYLRWWDKYPNKKKVYIEVYPHFKKRLQEINVALNSDDVRLKIIAIDNGISQWHIDFPVVWHLWMDYGDSENEEEEQNEWEEVRDLLINLDKLPSYSPYKRRLSESFYSYPEYYWVDRNGNGKKVNSHASYANLLSKQVREKAYEWMYNRGWARIIIDGKDMYINTSKSTDEINLSQAQREWIKSMLEKKYGEDQQRIRPLTIHGRMIDLYERLQSK